MLLDARSLPAGTHLDTDVAIVGAGPAGITLAAELAESGLKVMLLEAGGLKPDGRLEPFKGTVSDPRHPPPALYRVRALGGTTTLWGGRCIPLDPIDLEPRPWIPHSGWPIDWDELRPWYERALDFCEAGPWAFTAAEAFGAPAPLVEGLDGGELATDSLERFSPPTDFGRRYRRTLFRAEKVLVVLSAAVTGIEVEGRMVRRLTAAGHPGQAFTVTARWTVLAAGGLETARLMLANRLGNDHVGRFYMCHIEGKAAVMRVRPGTRVAFAYQRDRFGIYVRRRFSLPPELQRRERLTNVVLRFEPPVIADPAHGDPILSAMWVSRTFLKREYARRLDSFGYRGDEVGRGPALALRHASNIVLGAPRLAGFAADWLVRHVLARRKLPYVAVAGRNGAFSLDYNAEQVPDPDSRVTLGDSMDAHGLPRLAVDWRFAEADVEGVLAAHRLLARRLEATGIGRLDIDEEAVRQGPNAVGGHHIGTARMASDPSQGVVDPAGRVFGLENLYVAGSATFPTSGHANPTLTIVAMAARLAAHLRRLALRPPAPEMAQAAE